MKFLVATVLLICCPICSAIAQETPPTGTRRPNIIVLLADDLGYGETGAEGNRQIPTPHIDSIAAAGVRCDSGYVTASFCAPSRAGLLTGRYQTRFGFEGNPVGAKNEEVGIGLPASEVTIAEQLKAAGYATALIGKWHLGGTPPFHPQRHGFDEFFGFLHEGHYFAPPPHAGIVSHLRRRTLPTGERTGLWKSRDEQFLLSAALGHDEPPYDANNPILRDSQPCFEEDYLTDAFSREAADFIRQNRERPFLLYVAFNAVHSPMQATIEDTAFFNEISDPQRRVFAGMLRSLDRAVGKILGTVDEFELGRDTLIVFLSDNGGPTGELTSSNHPLRDGKGSVYEGGVRVPFMIKWDGHLPAGKTYSMPVSSLDLLPTALAAANVSDGVQPSLDGVNLLPFLAGDRPDRPHETLYWRMNRKAALRHGDWKIVRPGVTGDDDWELYDLKSDIGETNNLADDRPEVQGALLRRWEELDQQMVEPLF